MSSKYDEMMQTIIEILQHRQKAFANASLLVKEIGKLYETGEIKEIQRAAEADAAKELAGKKVD